MPDVQLIDDDTSGPDNRGGEPTFSVRSATTNASGKASITHTVSLQPGNNYRAGASVLQDAIYQADQATADAPHAGGASFSGYSVPLVWSEMLTVWRKLHVETDSMVRPTFAQNTFTMDWNDPEEGDVATQVRFDVDDPWYNPFQTNDEQFTSGYVELQDSNETLVLVARVVAYGNFEAGDDWVLINLPDCGGGQSGLACLEGIEEGTAILSDDDLSIEATFATKVWGCDDVYAGGGTALVAPDLNALELRYHPAYIDPVHETTVSGTGGLTTFLRACSTIT
ncbi:MAG: hypothetical protein WBE26_01040 [Phycisphaerae bacterium]